MGVRQGATVPVPSLRVQGEAEDAHRATHGTDAQREDLQTGARLTGPVHGMGGWCFGGGTGFWCTQRGSSASTSTWSSGRERGGRAVREPTERGDQQEREEE